MQPVSPRINTRIVPASGSNGISAKSLSEATTATQAIVNYAGNDVCYGLNPDFADLRSLSPDIQRLTRLTVEPFEGGSFVIPAVLETPPIEITTEEQTKRVSAQQVAERFRQMIEGFAAFDNDIPISIGALQALEGLNPLLRREAAAIEFSGHDSLGEAFTPVLVDMQYMSRVSTAKEKRQATRANLDELEGLVTALDIRKLTLQMELANQRTRVRGTYPGLYLQSLFESLGQKVRLKGYVTWKDDIPTHIQIYSVVKLDDAS